MANAYNEKLTYDKNGNIITLKRNGAPVLNNVIEIDDLQYSYIGNQLQTVTDATGNAAGFRKGSHSGIDYTYDGFGNMITDKNKGITDIKYNHLNLPTEITITGGKINYIYNAVGAKVQKIVTPTVGAVTTTDYLGGVQYENSQLQFFPTAEGYYNAQTNKYVYQYKDHLGNVRLSYSDTNGDGLVSQDEVLSENNYYPFGLQHQGDNAAVAQSANKSAEQYKYNGKELQDELGLGLYDYGARNYDAALGRWMNVDPLAEEFSNWSPYSYGFNNPLRFTDPDGMAPDDIVILGKNNSSITIQTDLIDVSVNAGSIVGDLGGNYTLEGTDVLIAALDIVGIVDPTGVADIAAATLEAQQGNYGSAFLSGLGVIPLVGDVGKVGKIGKHVKTIEKAIDGAKAVNGNSKASEKAQHIYEIINNSTKAVEKVGISSGKVSKAGDSYRATSQVNKLNKAGGDYSSRITEKISAGTGARTKALEAEKRITNSNKSTINPNIHKRPKPQ